MKYVIIKDDDIQKCNVGAQVELDGPCSCLDKAVRVVCERKLLGLASALIPVPIRSCEICAKLSSCRWKAPRTKRLPPRSSRS